MGINVGETLMGLVTTSGIYQYLTNPLALIMVAIACVLLYLAIVKQFEPLLLLPIAFGMLLTNLLGAILIGLVVGAGQRWANLSPTLLLFLRVGVCGGFTTFSTFSLESLVLLEDGRPVLFGGYVLLSVTLCLAGVWLGKHLIA